MINYPAFAGQTWIKEIEMRTMDRSDTLRVYICIEKHTAANRVVKVGEIFRILDRIQTGIYPIYRYEVEIKPSYYLQGYIGVERLKKHFRRFV